MSGTQFDNFDDRLRKIDQRHRALARGYVVSVNHDGLVIAEPRKERRRFPWRGMLLILVGMIVFKGLLHAQIGTEAYSDRVVMLSNGNIVEQVGAYAMAADPITLWISEQFTKVLP